MISNNKIIFIVVMGILTGTVVGLGLLAKTFVEITEQRLAEIRQLEKIEQLLNEKGN